MTIRNLKSQLLTCQSLMLQWKFVLFLSVLLMCTQNPPQITIYIMTIHFSFIAVTKLVLKTSLFFMIFIHCKKYYSRLKYLIRKQLIYLAFSRKIQTKLLHHMAWHASLWSIGNIDAPNKGIMRAANHKKFSLLCRIY